MVRSGAVAWVIIPVAAGMITATAITLGLGEDWSRRATDILWPAGDADPRVVVVAIDPTAQAQYGQWPWPREGQADLVEAIAAGGAAVIGYDIIVAGDETDVATDRLAAALGSVPSVVASGYASVVRGERGILVGSEPFDPDPRIARVATVAHTVVPADADGTTRSVALVLQTPRGELVPAFALALAARAGGTAGPVIVRPGAVEFGDVTAPAEAGALRVSWTADLAQGRPQVVSARSVLDGSVDAGLFRDSYVLVGIADITIGDTHVTPLQPGATTPGVVVQAQALNTLLHQAWVMPARWWAALAGILVLGGVAAFAALRLRPWLAVVVTAGLVASWVVLGVVALPVWGVLLDLVRVPLAVLLCAVAAGSLRLAREQRDRRRAVSLFSRYVPEPVAERLLDERGERALDGGVRLAAAVLFCDLRGFTPLAASLDPPEVRRALDLYYGYACERIFARGGTVMQFVGDEVFAVFGAPEPLADPTRSACEAADDLVGDIAELDSQLATASLPMLRFGVGVHSGPLVAGTVGASGRRQYAVVGDVVNIGSRLCGAARAGELIVSVATWDGAPPGPIEALVVKGRDDPIEVYRLAVDPMGAAAARE